jgi:EAL domain-containing protein (putative c-di-GMP-specific phosphodiesterase class I)
LSSELEGTIRALTDPMVVMRRVVDAILMLTPGADGAVVELISDGALICACAAGTVAAHVGSRRLRLEGSLSALAMGERKILVCEDSATDSRVDREGSMRVGAASVVCVPLYRGREPVGVLNVIASQPRAFDSDAVVTLTSLAGFISAAIGAASDIARVTAELLSFAPAAGSVMATGLIDAAARGAGAGSSDRVNEFVANVLQPGIVVDAQVKERIERVLSGSEFGIVCQPIIGLHSGALVGVEALTRFRGPPEQSPDVWFDQAHRSGLGAELELAAVKMALNLLGQVPRDAFLAINIGPEAIAAGELPALLASAGAKRIVLELTEHHRVTDYPHLRRALLEVRATGARLAIDDTGAGFASLAHILKLAPEMIKLDRDITRGIDSDPVRRALAGALVRFAAETGAEVTAEGIETEAELDATRALGISCGQGYLLGGPLPIASLPAGQRTAQRPQRSRTSRVATVRR